MVRHRVALQNLSNVAQNGTISIFDEGYELAICVPVSDQAYFSWPGKNPAECWVLQSKVGSAVRSQSNFSFSLAPNGSTNIKIEFSCTAKRGGVVCGEQPQTAVMDFEKSCNPVVAGCTAAIDCNATNTTPCVSSLSGTHTASYRLTVNGDRGAVAASVYVTHDISGAGIALLNREGQSYIAAINGGRPF